MILLLIGAMAGAVATYGACHHTVWTGAVRRGATTLVARIPVERLPGLVRPHPGHHTAARQHREVTG